MNTRVYFRMSCETLALRLADAGRVGVVGANGASLPGTAFGTGLHPLVVLGRRHFCARSRERVNVGQDTSELHFGLLRFSASSLSVPARGSQRSTCLQSDWTRVEVTRRGGFASGKIFRNKTCLPN